MIQSCPRINWNLGISVAIVDDEGKISPVYSIELQINASQPGVAVSPNTNITDNEGMLHLKKKKKCITFPLATNVSYVIHIRCKGEGDFIRGIFNKY